MHFCFSLYTMPHSFTQRNYVAGAAGWARDGEAIHATLAPMEMKLMDKGYTGDHKGPPIRSTPLSPLRRCSVSNLVHAPVDNRPRLQEGSFQIRLVILLSVVVRHRPRSIPWAQLADVSQTAIDQREHVLRRLLVEEPPIAPAGHVDR